MIDGIVDLVGSKAECLEMVELFLKRAKKEKERKGLLYRAYVGIQLVDESQMRAGAGRRRLDKLDDLEDGIDEEFTGKVEKLEGYL